MWTAVELIEKGKETKGWFDLLEGREDIKDAVANWCGEMSMLLGVKRWKDERDSVRKFEGNW